MLPSSVLSHHLFTAYVQTTFQFTQSVIWGAGKYLFSKSPFLYKGFDACFIKIGAILGSSLSPAQISNDLLQLKNIIGNWSNYTLKHLQNEQFTLFFREIEARFHFGTKVVNGGRVGNCTICRIWKMLLGLFKLCAKSDTFKRGTQKCHINVLLGIG